MTIFRHKNGKLYTLEMCKRPVYRLCATPYFHSEQIKRPKMADFTAIAERKWREDLETMNYDDYYIEEFVLNGNATH